MKNSIDSWRRRTLPVTLTFATVMLAGSDSAWPQQINEQARTLGIQWLLSNCETGQERDLASKLLQFKVELEPFFLSALQQGPDEKQLTDLLRASEARYQQRQEVLKDNPRLPLSDEDRRAAQAVSREQYLAQEREDFVQRYKSQAVAGLGIVGGPKAKAALEPLSKDEKSPLRGSAQQALKAMADAVKSRPPK